MEENNTNLEENQKKKKGLLIIPIIIGVVAAIALLGFGAVKGVNYLADEGYIEQPEFLNRFAGGEDEESLEIGDQDEFVGTEDSLGSDGLLFSDADNESENPEENLNNSGDEVNEESDELSEDSDSNDGSKSLEAKKADEDKDKNASKTSSGRSKRIAKAAAKTKADNPYGNPYAILTAMTPAGSTNSGSSSSSPARNNSSTNSSPSQGTSSGVGPSGGKPTGGSTPSGGTEEPDTPSQPSEDEVIFKINKAAGPITGYSLYDVDSKDVLTIEASDESPLGGTYYGNTASSIKEKQSSSTQNATVMIYICGTDLEDNNKEASWDLLQMLKSKYDTTKLNVLICAGGTNTWANDYMGENGDDGVDNDRDKANIYYLDLTGKIDGVAIKNIPANNISDYRYLNSETFKLIGSYDSVDMGDPKLLTGFVDVAYDMFPASSYDLIMWNHGGGVTGGVCTSDSYHDSENNIDVNGTGIETWELESALMSTKLYKDEKKLSFLGFDACLMGSAELAYNMAPYCDYMIGSSELSCGGWKYSDVFSILASSGTFTKQMATDIVDSYSKNHDKGFGGKVASLAAYDLKESQEMSDSINKMSKAIMAVNEYFEKEADKVFLEDEAKSYEIRMMCYEAIKKARIHSFEYGLDATNEKSYDFIDLNAFLANLSKNFEKMYELDWVSSNPKMLFDLSYAISCINNAEKSVADTITAAGINYENYYVYEKGINTGREIGIDLWNSAMGGSVSGISIYMPYRDSVYYDWYKINGESDNYYFGMGILDDYNDMLKFYSETLFKGSDANRVRRLANEFYTNEQNPSEGYDYGNLFEVASGDENETGRLESGRFDDSNPNTEYYRIKLKSSYGDTAPQFTSGNPFEDFMDTLSQINLYAVDKRENESGDESYVYVATKALSLGVISAANESLTVMKSRIEEAVSDIKMYAITHTREVTGEDGKNTSVTSIASHTTAVADISGEDASNNILRALTDDEEDMSNYAIFSGKYYAPKNDDQSDSQLTDGESADSNDTSEGAEGGAGGEADNGQGESSGSGLADNDDGLDATHVFKINGNDMVYVGSGYMGDDSEGNSIFNWLYQVADGAQDAANTMISFVERIISGHGIMMEDGIKLAVAEFGHAFELCKMTLQEGGITNFELGINTKGGAAESENGALTDTASSTYIFSDAGDVINIGSYSSGDNSGGVQRNESSSDNSGASGAVNSKSSDSKITDIENDELEDAESEEENVDLADDKKETKAEGVEPDAADNVIQMPVGTEEQIPANPTPVIETPSSQVEEPSGDNGTSNTPVETQPAEPAITDDSNAGEVDNDAA